jgi:menaquinone-dependent protoporphyrinogen oxidase
MRVLVTAASRHGATREIAGAIRGILAEAGHEADLVAPERVGTVRAYDAVVLGSAVYAGHWLPPARDLVERELDQLRTKRVWLFSSGPVGEPAKPVETPPEATAFADRVHAVEHRIFEGKLDRRALGFAEKAIVTMVGATEGDFRPWDEVVTWARGIEASLEGASREAGTREGRTPGALAG